MQREQLSIRLKPGLKRLIKARAKRENRSVSQTIETLLEAILQPEKRQPGEGPDASRGVEPYFTPGEPVGKYSPVIAPKGAEKLKELL